jgi:hypothetical protein
MRVSIDAPPQMSRAMHRTVAALRKYAPPHVEFTGSHRDADIAVLHVIGIEDLQQYCDASKQYIIMQYCWQTARGGMQQWHQIWRGAKFIWSYYALPIPAGIRFLRTPLGVDPHVFQWGPCEGRESLVLTSGYVNGPGAEAIEEVADAALAAGLRVIHIGPPDIAGMRRRTEASWSCRLGISDEELSFLYRRARWVSGLRRVEGFELPALEALSCGARPIVFDRPDMRAWYSGHSVMVSETGGTPLSIALTRIFRKLQVPVSWSERESVVSRFRWQDIAERFWKEVLR